MAAEERTDGAIGRIVAVRGSRLTALLRERAGRGDAVEFGGLVRIASEGGAIFGVVTEMWATDVGGLDERRLAAIDLLGEVAVRGGVRRFQRGVCRYPQLDDAVERVSPEDCAVVYARPDASCVRIGTIQQTSDLPAFVITDGLLGKHFAVLGTTGTGKSCTVALILRAILDNHPAGHVLILDPHNEYAPAFGSVAEVVTTATLRLPYWMMNADELVSTFVRSDGGEREAEINILKHAVLEARRRYVGADVDTAEVTVDTPTPFRIGDLQRSLTQGMGKLNKTESSLPYLRLQARIDELATDARFGFLFEGLMVKDTMADVLAQILRVPVDGRPATILDLSGVPSDVVDAVVSLLGRMVFDFALWSAEPHAVPLLLVCEEAHRYIPEDERLGFPLARLALARIAKEGRKYGVSLCLVSQRPSELSTTILSQCNTVFALRMTNDRDQEFVRKVLPEGASGLLAALPALHNREAIVVGEGVSIPMRVAFDEIAAERRPRSSTASFAAAWEYDTADRALLDETIERWRRQDRACSAQLGFEIGEMLRGA